MKTSNKFALVAVAAALCVAAFVSQTPKAEAGSGRISWHNHTNLTALTSADGSNNPAIIPAHTTVGDRQHIIISNPNAYTILADFDNIPTNAADIAVGTTKAIIIPATTSKTIDLGEGYNGEFSVRSTVTNASPKVGVVEFGN